MTRRHLFFVIAATGLSVFAHAPVFGQDYRPEGMLIHIGGGARIETSQPTFHEAVGNTERFMIFPIGRESPSEVLRCDVNTFQDFAQPTDDYISKLRAQWIAALEAEDFTKIDRSSMPPVSPTWRSFMVWGRHSRDQHYYRFVQWKQFNTYYVTMIDCKYPGYSSVDDIGKIVERKLTLLHDLQ